MKYMKHRSQRVKITQHKISLQIPLRSRAEPPTPYWLAIALLAILTHSISQPATAQATLQDLVFPRFEAAGGVFRIEGNPGIAQGPYKLVLDATEDEPESEVHSALEHAARALNLYALAGAPEDQVRVAVVIHGAATPIGLSDQAYERHFGRTNPNSGLLHQLRTAGVDVKMCGQALRHHGFSESDLAPGVTLELSAMTALVDLQNAGYALIP